jgi:hypothetical protein
VVFPVWEASHARTGHHDSIQPPLQCNNAGNVIPLERRSTMGDRGGRKDKAKGQKQSASKQKQKAKKKEDKQPKRKA